MVNFQLGITLVASSVLFLSCSTTTESNDSLDVPIKKMPAQSLKIGSDQREAAAAMLVLNPETVIHWQRFFKNPPNTAERNKLTQQLATWQETETATNLLTKARKELALGRHVAAEATLLRALKINQKDPETLLELAQLYLRNRQIDRAFEYLATTRAELPIEQAPNANLVFRYRYVLALGYLARQQRAKAHRVLSDLILIDKTFAPAYATLASSYIAQGKLDVAEFIAKRGLDRGKNSPALMNVLGLIEQEQNRHYKARQWFEKANKQSPTYVPAIINLGNSLIALEELEAAELTLNRAISIQPGQATAYISLGICQKQMGRHKAAQEALIKAIDLDPQSSSARFNLAVLNLDHLNNVNEARRLLHEVVQLEKNDPESAKLAKLYLEDIRQVRTGID